MFEILWSIRLHRCRGRQQSQWRVLWRPLSWLTNVSDQIQTMAVRLSHIRILQITSKSSLLDLTLYSHSTRSSNTARSKNKKLCDMTGRVLRESLFAADNVGFVRSKRRVDPYYIPGTSSHSLGSLSLQLWLPHLSEERAKHRFEIYFDHLFNRKKLSLLLLRITTPIVKRSHWLTNITV